MQTPASRADSAVPAGLTPPDSHGGARQRSRVVSFIRHYLEMVLAMFVGMSLLGPLWTVTFPGVATRADVNALVMASDMAVGMAAWMLIRRNSWPHIAEMTAAMYLPFVVLLLPYWLGMISGETLLTGGHVLMFATMAAAMLWRHSRHAGTRSSSAMAGT